MLPRLKLAIYERLAKFDKVLTVNEEQELLKLQIGQRNTIPSGRIEDSVCYNPCIDHATAICPPT